MKKAIVAGIILTLLLASMVVAAPKTYQVTGTVLSIAGDIVTVEKGKEKWEIAIPKDVKTTGELKVGSKVTILYTMTATSLEVKAAEAAKKPAAAGKK